jgi:hypothetical protein
MYPCQCKYNSPGQAIRSGTYYASPLNLTYSRFGPSF